MTYWSFISVLLGFLSPQFFIYPFGRRRIFRKDEFRELLMLQIMIYLHLSVFGIYFRLLPFSHPEVDTTILDDPVVRVTVTPYCPCQFGTQPCLSISFRSALGTLRPATLITGQALLE